MEKVGVVIVHYGDKKDTFECLASLKKIKYPRTSFYVVDNGTNAVKKLKLMQFFLKQYSLPTRSIKVFL